MFRRIVVCLLLSVFLLTVSFAEAGGRPRSIVSGLRSLTPLTVNHRGCLYRFGVRGMSLSVLLHPRASLQLTELVFSMDYRFAS